MNRRDPKGGLYHDLLIHSPGVPVFREDANFTLLDRDFPVDFVTCPAVNKGRVAREENCTADRINEVTKGTEAEATRCFRTC